MHYRGGTEHRSARWKAKMKVLYTTVTRKGQITVPKEAREALGLREGDRVNVILREGRVEIERAGGVIAMTAGIFGGRSPSMPVESMRDAAEQAIADSVV